MEIYMKKTSAKKSELAVLENELLSLYLLVMLGFFPVHYRYQYSKMGNSKYAIFQYSSLICVIGMALLLITGFVLQVKKEGMEKTKSTMRFDTSLLDKTVIVYFVCTTLSYLFCGFKKDGFFGYSNLLSVFKSMGIQTYIFMDFIGNIRYFFLNRDLAPI